MLTGTSLRRTAVVAVLLAALLGLQLVGSALAVRQATPAAGVAATPDPAAEAVDRAIAYLIEQQGVDGGFVGFDSVSDPATTTDAILALKAAGIRGVATESVINSAIGYLEEEGAEYATSGPGQAAKMTLAVVAAGVDPTGFGGNDLIALATTPMASPEAGTPAALAGPGVYGDDLYDHALVLLALAAAGEPAPPAAIEVLRASQGEDGSWSFTGATDPGAGDSNTTALVIQALIATGNGDDPMIATGLEALRATQTINGQFAFQAAEPLVADANSTALAIQAIVAAGQDPSSADEWMNAARGLAAFQNVSGAFRYQDSDPTDNLLATLQAIPALAGLPLPIGVVCETEASTPAAEGTPVIALPAPASGQTPCIEVAA